MNNFRPWNIDPKVRNFKIATIRKYFFWITTMGSWVNEVDDETARAFSIKVARMGRRGSCEIRANSNRIQTWSISFHRGILACNITRSLRGRLFRNWTRDVVKPLSRPALPQPNSRVIYIFQLDPTPLSINNNLYLTTCEIYKHTNSCFIRLFSSFVLKMKIARSILTRIRVSRISWFDD